MKDINTDEFVKNFSEIIRNIESGTSYNIFKDNKKIAELTSQFERVYNSDVFISYSRRDIGYARIIKENIENKGLQVWIDWIQIPIGREWWKEISTAIELSNTFVVLLSKPSLSSKVCKEELDLAIKNGKRIIPILLDDLTVIEVEQWDKRLPQTNWLHLNKEACFIIKESNEDVCELKTKEPLFQQSIDKLEEAIKVNWDWVKTHSWFLERAKEWNYSEEDGKKIIGSQLQSLREAIHSNLKSTPVLTKLQRDFYNYCEKQERSRLSGGKWYQVAKQDNYFTFEYDYICNNCNYLYVFTPSDKIPPPQNCPNCSFDGKYEKLKDYTI